MVQILLVLRSPESNQNASTGTILSQIRTTAYGVFELALGIIPTAYIYHQVPQPQKLQSATLTPSRLRSDILLPHARTKDDEHGIHRT